MRSNSFDESDNYITWTNTSTAISSYNKLALEINLMFYFQVSNCFVNKPDLN